MKFCPECGSQLPIGTAKFCPNCGKSLWDATSGTSNAEIQSKETVSSQDVFEEFQKQKEKR